MNKNSFKKKGYSKIKTSKLLTLYVIPKETSSCQEGSDLKGKDLLLQIPLRHSGDGNFQEEKMYLPSSPQFCKDF